MFGTLFKQAQATVETSIGHVVDRAVVAVPFLIAGGFATAALSLRLTRELGGETATLIMAALFATLGLLVVAVQAMRPKRAVEPADIGENAQSTGSSSAESPGPDWSKADKDILMAALSTAAPMALPQLLRLVLKNLPLVATIAAAIFVMTRPATGVGVGARSASDDLGGAVPAE